MATGLCVTARVYIIQIKEEVQVIYKSLVKFFTRHLDLPEVALVVSALLFP
jgi:hypothetical protein